MNLKAGSRLGWMLAVAGGVGCGGQEGAEPQEAGGLRVVREQALGEASGSRGREFWLAFPTNYDSSVTLTVFITGETATMGTGRVPGQAFTANFAVTPGQVTSVVVPATSMLATYQSAENKGAQVTAAADVTSSGQAAGGPFSVTLNRGQTYQLNTGVTNADVSGSLITADKPVAVYGGHKCANIPTSGTGACDFIVEQLPPLSAWGKSFVTVPLATRLNGDTFRFVASANATQVSVNGAVVATLNRGQVHQRNTSGSAVITSTQPILVAQYSNGTTYDGVLSDPFMMLIPPYEQFLTEYTMTTPAAGFRVNYLNVVVPTSGIGTVLLDGAPILATNFKPIGAFMYGFDSADSYGYPGGMSLATVSTSLGAPLAGVRVDLAVTGAHTLARSANSATAVWRVNSPPVVSAGPNRSASTRATLTLNGSATDADGDALTVASVTVDTTAPSLQVLSPTPQDVLASKTFTVTSAVADAIPVTVTTQFVRKGEVPSGTGVLAHPVTVGSTGYSTVLVQARDAAGNVAEVRVRVYVAP